MYVDFCWFSISSKKRLKDSFFREKIKTFTFGLRQFDFKVLVFFKLMMFILTKKNYCLATGIKPNTCSVYSKVDFLTLAKSRD